MDSSNDRLDKLISETLNSIYNEALNDGRANSFKTLAQDAPSKKNLNRSTKRNIFASSSFLSVAASLLLIVGLGLFAMISSQNDPTLDTSRHIKSANKVASTSTTISKTDPNIPVTSSPLIVDDENTPTTTSATNKQNNQNPPPFISSPNHSAPATVNQLARVSYSNTRAGDIALDGATISGNVYIFISDSDVNSALWFLDDGGKFEKGTQFRGGKTLPIDFNYRESDRLTPKPFNTDELSVGEHTLGIQTLSKSTGKYSNVLIKFQVSR